MIPIYVINLQEDIGRLDAMKSRLGALGLSFQRFPAYRGRDVPARWLGEFESQSYGIDASFLKDGEIGCYASHLGVLETFLQTDASAALVLEDDVELRMNFLSILDNLQYIPSGWDILRLSNPALNLHIVLRPLASGANLVKYYNIPMVAAGYFISRCGAAKVIAAKSLRFLPYDHAIGEGAYICMLRTYGVDPPPVVQIRDIESSIDSLDPRTQGGKGKHFGFIGKPRLFCHPRQYFRKVIYRIRELTFLGWLRCEVLKRVNRYTRIQKTVGFWCRIR